MSNQRNLGFVIIGLVLIIAIILFSNSKLLIPAGYELAIDGYVIARTLVIVFILYIVSKLGFSFIK